MAEAAQEIYLHVFWWQGGLDSVPHVRTAGMGGPNKIYVQAEEYSQLDDLYLRPEVEIPGFQLCQSPPAPRVTSF
jgi:hypothetical protein